MPNQKLLTLYSPAIVAMATVLAAAALHRPQNVSTVNTNTNSRTNSNANTGSYTSTTVESREPQEYQATVTLRVQALGNQTAELPTLSAVVARSGEDRRMSSIFRPVATSFILTGAKTTAF
jgi:hypothetical protein